MTIQLPKDVEMAIEAAVHGGQFASVNDAVIAAWRVFEQTQLGRGPAGQSQSQTKTTKRTKPAPPKKPLTPAEFDQHLLELGLITELPDTAADFDDPDDEPIAIKGEPLSETVMRERR